MSFNFMATITICSDFGAKEKYPWGEKMAKWLSEETLQIAMKRREAKGKEQEERYTHLNAEFQRIARRDLKSLPQQSMQRNRGKQ